MPPQAEVAELADAPDSKSGSLRGVWVRFPPSAFAAPEPGAPRETVGPTHGGANRDSFDYSPVDFVGLQEMPGFDPIEVRKSLTAFGSWPQDCVRPGS